MTYVSFFADNAIEPEMSGSGDTREEKGRIVRLKQVWGYTLGKLRSIGYTNSNLFGVVKSMEDHKGQLTVFVKTSKYPLRKDVETSLREAWEEVGGEPSSNVDILETPVAEPTPTPTLIPVAEKQEFKAILVNRKMVRNEYAFTDPEPFEQIPTRYGNPPKDKKKKVQTFVDRLEKNVKAMKAGQMIKIKYTLEAGGPLSHLTVVRKRNPKIEITTRILEEGVLAVYRTK